MQVRSGVRAITHRRHEGAVPYLGRLHSSENWWVLTGLGVRGLVYHALMAELTVQAMRSQDEALIPKPLRAWQEPL